MKLFELGLGLGDDLLGGRGGSSSSLDRSSSRFLGIDRLSVTLLRDFIFLRKRLISIDVFRRLQIIGFGLPQRGLCGVK